MCVSPHPPTPHADPWWATGCGKAHPAAAKQKNNSAGARANTLGYGYLGDRYDHYASRQNRTIAFPGYIPVKEHNSGQASAHAVQRAATPPRCHAAALPRAILTGNLWRAAGARLALPWGLVSWPYRRGSAECAQYSAASRAN